MSLGKLTNSIFSATNENTAALANLNFDFSLVKFEAPIEFAALGKALSSRRRNDAEDGHLHRTARRLGALFEALIPPIPELKKAYGLRVSDIIESPNVNPQTFRNYGPFQDFVGADGTSIWAAVTSSSADSPTHSPLAVHLLACVLARAFTPSEATAIWTELVSERQKKIQSDIGDFSFNQSSLWAARQDITRRELAEWDASARSWLRSADDVKNSEQTRLMLILKKISCPVSRGESTYSQVTEACRQALGGIERLLKGMPQQVSNASVLLALSSWHLYPSLNVLAKQEPVQVTFDDPLFPREAVVTIGLHPSDPAKADGMTWSLMLSHLRYYGDPVAVRSSDDNTRVTMTKLRCIMLAGLFANWNIPLKDTINAAKFLADLMAHYGLQDRRSDALTMYQIDSFQLLALAAKNVLDLQREGEDEFDSIIRYGRRRAKYFLAGGSSLLPPMFGLLNTHVLHALSEDDPTEIPIRYLRNVAKSMNLNTSDAIISYPHPSGQRGLFVYTTAVPHERISSKRTSDNLLKPELLHCRWLVQHRLTQSNNCSCSPVCTTNCPCAISHNICSPYCHPTENRRCQCFRFNSKPRAFNHLGEVMREVDQNQVKIIDVRRLFWTRPPMLFHSHEEASGILSCCPSLLDKMMRCTCFDMCPDTSNLMHDAVFSKVKGSAATYALWVNERTNSPLHFQETFEKTASAPVSLISAADLIKKLVNNRSLLSYMAGLQSQSYHPQSHGILLDGGIATAIREIVIDKFTYPRCFWESTRAIGLASHIYRSLQGATIPLRIISTMPEESLWLPVMPDITLPELTTSENGSPMRDVIEDDEMYSDGGNSDSGQGRNTGELDKMNLEQTFACIAMFESGTQNIRPLSLQDVMALSSGNSLFIVQRLISDPLSKISKTQVQRIVGNIGRPGIALLVPPRDVRSRPPTDDYKIVQHARYDMKRENNFQGTTLHLSFTEWELPIDVDTRSAIDVEVSLLEAVISVYDSGQWVGDLDIMRILYGHLQRMGHSKKCIVAPEMQETSPSPSSHTGTAIDTWEDFLDPPEGTAIFRAHKNWPVRLAATCLALQKSVYDEVILIDPDVAPCNHCLGVEDGSCILID